MSSVLRLGDGVYRLGDMVIYRVISWDVRRRDVCHRRPKAKTISWHVDRMRTRITDDNVRDLLDGNMHRSHRDYIDAFETHREAMEYAEGNKTR